MIRCPKCGTEYDGAEKFCPKDGTRLGDAGEEGHSRNSAAHTRSDSLIGMTVQGRYKVLAQIGEGGMGVVYTAQHVEIEKIVALKVLRDDFSKRPEVVARFRQEAKSASKIGNAHIVDVTDFGQLENGGVYFVMEHLKGKGLSEVISKEVIPMRRAISIVIQIARALKAAHNLGIVHRDLKPENIFLVENDEQTDFVKVLDFGIAKISDRDSEGQRLTKTGMIFGTPEYMSPEQASGKPLDHRVDIYALGCIMFEMFTGRVPYEGETFMAVLTQHMFEPVPAIEEMNPQTDVTEGVREIVYKAMAKDKEDRYHDMESMALDLERALYAGDDGELAKDIRNGISAKRNGMPREANTMGWTPDVSMARKGKRRMAMPAAGILLAMAAGGVGVLHLKGYIGTEVRGDVAAAAGVERDEEKPDGSKGDRDMEREPALGDAGGLDRETEKETETGESGGAEEHTIIVRIESDPEGAVVFVEGMGQVCSKSPCDISMKKGEPKEIEARYQGRSERIVFTPSSQNRDAFIELPEREKERRKKRPQKSGKRQQGTKQPSQGSGLKIPDIFKNN